MLRELGRHLFALSRRLAKLGSDDATAQRNGSKDRELKEQRSARNGVVAEYGVGEVKDDPKRRSERNARLEE